jgi:hypothetical protein
MLVPACFSIAARNSLFSDPLNVSVQESVTISSCSETQSELLSINGSVNIFWFPRIFSLLESPKTSSFSEDV